jgi:hypothetical protein
MKANNEVETNEKDEEEKMSPLKDDDDVYVKYLAEGETLVVRRALDMQIKLDDLESQRKNIFHMPCS